MNRVKVLLFAQARQIADAESIEVMLPENGSVADLRAALSDAVPQLADLLARSSIALDQKYAVDQDVVNPGVEVAMIPPVSGG
ncbi:MoaD/ThiS family protein [Mariniblastus fucicola]|uniref:Molybdopterin synthase sulfur carrier subunit n=1 Tax=Mariniblastus fucicola TaxID=980251 RepID=A0A5B9PH62_9BACT|nr:MoaD/ThiS family protein [Mariniblastus fucicola]QEG22191.1 Molybdopterin synthase sulfur carrier subunit [Mariniblastus fucicola]